MDWDFVYFESAVRKAQEHNQADIVQCYVHLGLLRAKKMSDKCQTKRAHLRVVDTLLETFCDDLLPLHYRQRCYKTYCRLKPILFEILDKKRFEQHSMKAEKLRD